MSFYYFHPSDNVADTATVTTTGTEDASYPLENAVDFSWANIHAPSKITGTSGRWVLDFGSAQRVDAVLIWHNLAAGTAYSIQMNAANSWGGPTVDVSSTAPSKFADSHTVKIFKDLTTVTGYSASGFRYLSVNVSGTNDAPVGLKVMAFSQIRTPSRNVEWGVEWQTQVCNVSMRTDAMVPWAYDLGSSARRISAKFKAAKNADALKMSEWFRACAGGAHPTVIVLDPTAPDPILGTFAESGQSPSGGQLTVARLGDTHSFTNNHQIAFALDEIASGDPEWY